MRTEVLLVLLAFAAAADARHINGFRNYWTDDKRGPMYCEDYHGHSDCPEYYECQKLEQKACKSKPVCSADSYGRKHCRYEAVCWERQCVEAPRYCDPYSHYNECEKDHHHGWECTKLDKEVCTYRDECRAVPTGKCQEYDYENKCHYVQGKCKAYDHKKECRDEKFCVEYKQEQECDFKRVCKAYNQKQVCEDQSFCVEYKQQQRCETRNVCKAYDQAEVCKPNQKCEKRGHYGECTKYGQDCTYKQGGCKEYETQKYNCQNYPTNVCIKYDTRKVNCRYVHTDCKEYENQEHNCRYHPTDVCIKHDTRKVDCKYVNTHCKEYEQVENCVQIKGGCRTYEQKNECKKVEDVCWKGKCEKKRYPSHSAYSSPSPKKKYIYSGYWGYWKGGR